MAACKGIEYPVRDYCCYDSYFPLVAQGQLVLTMEGLLVLIHGEDSLPSKRRALLPARRSLWHYLICESKLVTPDRL